MERKPAALFAPVIINMPPGNSFSNIVFEESLLLFSDTFARNAAVDSIIGAMRCLLSFFDISSVGSTRSVGPGHRSMMTPVADDSHRAMTPKG